MLQANILVLLAMSKSVSSVTGVRLAAGMGVPSCS